MSAKDSWCRDLSAELASGRLDPVLPRAELLSVLMRVLARRTKRNAVLTGRPGVGKTALAESLAQVLSQGGGPPALAGASVLSLDLGALLSGTGYRGDFEGRVNALLRRLRSAASPPVLFIDEIHLLQRAGRSEGGIDAANLLKPALARGEIICLGASTPEEWGSVAERDPALARRFTVLEVPEPSPAEVLRILEVLRPGLERHHGLRISDEALQAAAHMPADPRCPTGMPDRAVDRLDEACAALQVAGLAVTEGPAPAFSLRARTRELGLRGPARECGLQREPGGTAATGQSPPPPCLLACHINLDTGAPGRLHARAV